MALTNLQSFNETARDGLLQLLGDVPGRKNLVLQRSLVSRIELLLKFSTLQEQGIDRIFYLENDNVDSSQRNVVFIVSGEKAQYAQAVAEQIKRLQQTASTEHDFTILWTPRRTMVSEKILEEAGILGDVTSQEWPLYFHALEKDLLSLEMEESFRALSLRHDTSSIFMAAKALNTIQQDHGLFPRILGKGDNAKRLAELLQRKRPEAIVHAQPGQARRQPVGSMPSATIENLIIIDREVDMATPLMTQLTYEGLIDETCHIRHGQVEVSPSVVGPANNNQQAQPQAEQPPTQQSSSALKRKVRLDSSDKLYDQLRDANFAIVGSLLNKVARRLQTDYKGYEGGKQKTVAELKDLVNKLPGYQVEQQSLKLHTGLAEDIMKQTRSDVFSRSLEIQQNVIAGTDPSSMMDAIEDLIARDCPLAVALRLITFCSTVAGGLRAKDFDSFRTQILHAYGHEHILTLDNLEKMQLLTSRSGLGFSFPTSTPSLSSGTKTTAPQRTDYTTLRRSLNLIVDDVSETEPSDIAYAYSGYAPLSARLVQCILQKPYLASLSTSRTPALPGASSASTYTEASSGWRGFESALSAVKGATVDIEQKPEEETANGKSAKARQTLQGSGGRRTTIVFFLGGITFAEVAALRFVAEQERQRRDVVIATTGMVRGDGVVGAAIEDVLKKV